MNQFESKEEINWLQIHLQFAHAVSTLPILRAEMLQAQWKVSQGLLGNSVEQEKAYNRCVHVVKTIAATLA